MTPEKKVENAMRKNLDTLGYYYVKNFGGPHSNKGIPDITGVANGCYFAIEVKRADSQGKPTPVQLQHLYQIAKNGGIAILSCRRQIGELVERISKTRGLDNNCTSLRLDQRVYDITPKSAAILWQQRASNIDTYLITI